MAHACRAKRIKELHSNGMAHCQSGEFDQAVDHLTMALREVKKIGLECYQAKILNNLGLVFELQGKRQQARDHYQQALSMTRKKLGQRAGKAVLYRVVDANLARVA